MSITIKPHQNIEIISNIRTKTIKKFIHKVFEDDTEATLYGPDGSLTDIITAQLYQKWCVTGYRIFLEDSVIVNNKTGEFIIFQCGVWKHAENCRYRGAE